MVLRALRVRVQYHGDYAVRFDDWGRSEQMERAVVAYLGKQVYVVDGIDVRDLRHIDLGHIELVRFVDFLPQKKLVPEVALCESVQVRFHVLVVLLEACQWERLCRRVSITDYGFVSILLDPCLSIQIFA